MFVVLIWNREGISFQYNLIFRHRDDWHTICRGQPFLVDVDIWTFLHFDIMKSSTSLAVVPWHFEALLWHFDKHNEIKHNETQALLWQFDKRLCREGTKDMRHNRRHQGVPVASVGIFAQA